MKKRVYWVSVAALCLLQPSPVYSQTKADANKTGLSLIKSGRLQEAVKHFDAAIKANQKDPALYRNRALAYRNLRQLDKALKDLDAVVALNPNNPVSYADRGDLYFLGGEAQKAIDDYTKAFTIDPKFIRALDARANTCNLTGNFAKAIQDYTSLLSLDPKNAAVYFDNRAFAYRKLKDFANAERDYDEAVKLAPNTPAVFVDRASCYVDQKKYEEALADYDVAVQLDPKLKAAYLDRAFCYIKMNKKDKAMADVNTVLSLQPTNVDQAVMLSMAALVHNNEGKFAQAIDEASKAIALAPGVAVAYVERARAFNATQQHAKAYQDCLIAAELGYQDKALLVIRAEALEHLAAQDRNAATGM